MIETRQDFAQINATLADTVPDEHEELLLLFIALQAVAKAASHLVHHTKGKDEERMAELFLSDKIKDLPDWIMEYA